MRNRTPEQILIEVQALISELMGYFKNSKIRRAKLSSKSLGKTKILKGPTGGIHLLISDGFFESPVSLQTVEKKLRQDGYHYVTQVISTALVRLVRDRILVRVPAENPVGKEKWAYAERK